MAGAEEFSSSSQGAKRARLACGSLVTFLLCDLGLVVIAAWFVSRGPGGSLL